MLYSILSCNRSKKCSIYTSQAYADSYQLNHSALQHMSTTSSMFFPICGHLTPLHGGTRAQYGAASFQPGYPVIRCQHCQQLAPPTTHTELPPPAPHVAVDPRLTSAHSTPPAPHIAVDPRLTSAHSTAYSPISQTTVSSTGTAAPDNSFGDFKSASFGNALLTAQKGGRSSDHTVGHHTRPAASSLRPNDQGQRRKGKQPEKADTHTQDLEDPPTPPALVRKYSLKLIISHFDTPFKLEAVPHTEEWSPTAEELDYDIYGIFINTSFGEIIKQTGLWDTLTTMKPNCTYNLFLWE